MDSVLLSIKDDQFNEGFDCKPFLVEHQLSNHPLFQLPRLLELCRNLSNGQIEYNSGKIPPDQNGSLTPGNGLSAEETIRRIKENASWLVLKNIETDSAYKALLDKILAPIRKNVNNPHAIEGFIFISSPGAVTPYHIDPEHNFLLQISGTKKISIFDRSDRTLISEEALETFWCGNEHRNMKYKDEFQTKAEVIELVPGAGLHLPVNAPHWVKVGPDVSISFSVTFRSELSRRRSVLHAINRKLRQLGITPSPVGQSTFSDCVKHLAYRSLCDVRRKFRGAG